MGRKNNAPVLCQQIAPWADPSVTLEDLHEDLMGSVISLYHRYADLESRYTVDDAISDSMYGIVSAIEKDKMAPTIAGRKVFCTNSECKCSAEANKNKASKDAFKIQIPETMPGDERANRIAQKDPRRIKLRRFMVTCPECGHEWLHTVYKTVFSSLVFNYIRSEIQRGVRAARDRAPRGTSVLSLDTPLDDSGTTMKSLQKAPEKDDVYEELPEELRMKLMEALHTIPERHQTVVALCVGLGGYHQGEVNKKVKCQSCKVPFTTTLDVQYSNHVVECPECHEVNHITAELTQAEVGDFLGITKQRVCNIFKTSMKNLAGKLSPYLRNQGYTP